MQRVYTGPTFFLICIFFLPTQAIKIAPVLLFFAMNPKGKRGTQAPRKASSTKIQASQDDVPPVHNLMICARLLSQRLQPLRIVPQRFTLGP